MKIRYASDLHVGLNTRYYDVKEDDIIKKLNLDNIDLLILAGDTDEYPENLYFCKKLMELYPKLKIIEIAGNHLYHSCDKYFKSMQDIDNYCRSFAKEHENYYFLNNNSVIINNVKFIGSTMWTRLGETFSNVVQITNCLNDFRYIYNDDYGCINYSDIIKLHDKSWNYIKKELNNSEQECVVITHHAPFLEYLSPISHAFGIELKQKMKYLKKYPKYWVYGHTHVNHDKTLEFKRGKIECICNQFGYNGESEQGSQFDAWKTYDENKEIEL